ncbi:membrane associated potassium channel [Halovivax asiaticus JCM 14624]|uniref:Membrane associated potassium channel n=2 Tax=Halovivax asiaticus TaxID=332953 RepID=M0QT64_9EURY|nr:membrane associated potassium channel [Halovivax asiaticus JCM 14624]
MASMRWPYVVLGASILVATVIDILWTTLWVDGGSGPLAGRLSTGIWRGLRRVSDERRTLSTAGPLILTGTLVLWIAGIWAGWSLVFAAEPWALVSTRTGLPADWPGRIYYVAYTMFTDGNGDYSPRGDVWELASALTTATGMAFVTLGVSYVLTVLSAVSQKRSFASAVTGLGERSEAFVRAGHTDTEGFDGIERPLESVGEQLGQLADQHQSYPILHYYHSERPTESAAVAVAILDDALTVFECGLPEGDGPNRTAWRVARASVDQYLHTLDTAFVDPADDPPPLPALDRLRRADIDTVSDDAFADALAKRSERRRTTLGVVRGDAWEWPPVDDETA